MPCPYPLLEALVSGRTVHVFAKKHDRRGAPAGVLTARFNEDDIPADIWATAFAQPPSPVLAASARLIVGTVPDGTESIPEVDLVKDFTAQRRDFLHRAGHPLPPIEQAESGHWRTIREAAPAIPLSGIVLMGMLTTTSVAACVVHGMDFYAGLRTPMHRGRWFGYVHDLLMAAGWTRALAAADPRFVFPGTDLDACVAEVGGRMAEIAGIHRQHEEAQAALTGGDADRVMAILDPLLDRHPWYYTAFTIRAKAAMLRGDWAMAEQDWRSCLDTAPAYMISPLWYAHWIEMVVKLSPGASALAALERFAAAFPDHELMAYCRRIVGAPA
jgi:hypothetical protein